MGDSSEATTAKIPHSYDRTQLCRDIIADGTLLHQDIFQRTEDLQTQINAIGH